ncbi:hypothetical protein ACIP93_31095 [Streptomyces sp. NPDC088745]|uniref:hypothetical protein n=2 Tax=unclassified Streptomyces TaxID=2593676 RepID=UPI00380E4B1F
MLQVTATVTMTDVTRYMIVSGAPAYVVMDGADVAYILDPEAVVIEYRKRPDEAAYTPFKATVTGYRLGPEGRIGDERASGWQMLGTYEPDETPQWLRGLAERHRPRPSDV